MRRTALLFIVVLGACHRQPRFEDSALIVGHVLRADPGADTNRDGKLDELEIFSFRKKADGALIDVLVAHLDDTTDHVVCQAAGYRGDQLHEYFEWHDMSVVRSSVSERGRRERGARADVTQYLRDTLRALGTEARICTRVEADPDQLVVDTI